MGGFPKIPGMDEIAGATKKAMQPMADDITDIKNGIQDVKQLLTDLVEVQRQILNALQQQRGKAA